MESLTLKPGGAARVLWTLAMALATTVILVTAQPISREGEMPAAGGSAPGGRAMNSGGGDERNIGARFRAGQFANQQEAMLRNLDALGGGHLLRDLDPYGDSQMQRPSRNFDSVVGTTFGEYKRLDPLTGTSFGGQKRSNGHLSNAITELLKRNFDEIDRSGFDSFVKRNNFDEIDRYGFDGFVRKRRSGVAAPSHVSLASASKDPRNAETGHPDNRLEQH